MRFPTSLLKLFATQSKPTVQINPIVQDSLAPLSLIRLDAADRSLGYTYTFDPKIQSRIECHEVLVYCLKSAIGGRPMAVFVIDKGEKTLLQCKGSEDDLPIASEMNSIIRYLETSDELEPLIKNIGLPAQTGLIRDKLGKIHDVRQLPEGVTLNILDLTGFRGAFIRFPEQADIGKIISPEGRTWSRWKHARAALEDQKRQRSSPPSSRRT